MVVAVKKDDKITVGITGCDSLIDMTEKDLALAENIPFWKVRGTKDCYVFAEDLTYGVDLLRHNDYIFKNITDGKSIIADVVPKMKELLSNYSRVINGKEWDSQLLIIKGDKMYKIGYYFTVSEEDNLLSLGFDSYILGGLSEMSEENPSESIVFAIRTLNRMRSRNLFPLTLFDSKTKRRKVVYN